jgi:hypothetical protein
VTPPTATAPLLPSGPNSLFSISNAGTQRARVSLANGAQRRRDGRTICVAGPTRAQREQQATHDDDCRGKKDAPEQPFLRQGVRHGGWLPVGIGGRIG